VTKAYSSENPHEYPRKFCIAKN